MRLACASMCVLLLAAPRARAESEAERLSEAEFIERYRSAEPRFDLAEADVATAEAAVAEAGRLVNPVVRLEQESVADDSETLVGLAVTLDIGARGPRTDGARAKVRATRERAAHTRWGLVIDALHAYYDTVRNRERVALLRAARSPLQDIVDLLAAQATEGESAGYARDRLELELARYDERLQDALNGYRRTQLALGSLLGDPEAGIDAGGSLSVQPPAKLADLPAVSENRADLRAAKERARAATKETKAAGRWWIPTVGLSGGIKTVSVAGTSDTGYFFGVSLELPLFDRSQSERQRSSASRARESATLAYLAVSIPADVRDAHAALTADLDQLAAVEQAQVPRAERLVDRANLIYREGEGGVVELLDAHRVALEVKLRRLELQHRAKHDELELWRALGSRTDGGAQ